MAANDPFSNFNSQQASSAAEYKDAWGQDLVGGAGQFTTATPFSNAQQSLSMTNPAETPLPEIASNMAKTKPAPEARTGTQAVDALPTAPAGSTSTDPIEQAVATVSNYSADKPYVSDVTDDGDVGRQAERPERLAIDDTLSAEEQYRRAWQNEANGYYGDANFAQPAVPVEKVPVEEAAPAHNQDDYRLPVDMTEAEFNRIKSAPWWEEDPDQKFAKYKNYGEYVDAWYDDDRSKLINRTTREKLS